MKKIVIIGLCIVFLVVLVAGSYKPLIYNIFNDYEEVCVDYQQNVTARCKHIPYSFLGSSAYYINWSYCIREKQNDTIVFNPYTIHHDYVSNGVCIEYELRRKIDIEPFIYLFDWCEVYPNSEECM